MASPLVPTSPAVTASIVAAPSDPTTSIPFLSELLSQLFSHSSSPTENSTPTDTLAPSSVAAQQSETDKPTMSGPALQNAPSLGVTGGSEESDKTESMAPTLIYSLTLPPYSGGLDSSGIAETMTVSSTGDVNTDVPSASTYSYSLLPYTPKIPTYVASSAATAPLSLTSGALGAPIAGAPTTRILLKQGFVNPIQDLPPSTPISVIPVYSPACLGNAYGGGYVITPTMFVANPNATGIAMIPPAYGFSYKLEPTPSPGYSAAVVLVDTKATMLAATPTPLDIPATGVAIPSISDCAQCSVATAKDISPTPSASLIPFKDLIPTPTGDLLVSQSSIVPQMAGRPTNSMSVAELPSPKTTAKSISGPASAAGSHPGIYSGQNTGYTSSITSGLESIADTGIQTPRIRVSSVIATVTVNVNCSTSISASAADSLLPISTARSSIVASIVAPNQVHRAAGLSDATITNTGSTLETDYLRFEFNRTFTLSGNASEFVAFEGGSLKLTPSVLAFTIAIAFVYYAVNIV
ncbi:MAG: hypothetical protein Q9222_002627 [Ikaeria aurantiellina]